VWSVISTGDVRIIAMPSHRRDDGEVVVAETVGMVPFAIARMFVLRATPGAERGKHAHRRCSQLMMCVSGVVDVSCDDGESRRIFTLDRSDVALLVPPTIWNTVVFRREGSVLVVLCDRPYEASDYIREYPEFLAQRKAVGA
jgi:dTDP-4-dehydrorhamnose 3,5-epimerase-like enzyme